jgi:hypothetical protein
MVPAYAGMRRGDNVVKTSYIVPAKGWELARLVLLT